LRRDKEDKFGKGAPGTAITTGIAAGPKHLEPIEAVQNGIKMVSTIYTEDRQPGIAKTCFKTC
jgi:hypothetical protein